MRRFLAFALYPVLFLLAILFGATNHHTAVISLAPLPFESDIPVFLLVMISIIIGFLIGVATMWLRAGSQRKELRSARKELKKSPDTSAPAP